VADAERETAKEGGVPASEAVNLQRATPDMAPMLRNLLELYVHDLSEIFPVELGPEGRFGYDKLPLYWAEPSVRHAFVIKHGGLARLQVCQHGLAYGCLRAAGGEKRWVM
jgi:hypothetical protein